jgi:AcrR family transcriptional regulator
VPELSPRKLPRQARSRATFEAIVDACARLLRERPLAEITTNHIARRAGVGIGSLYEFFPNREAVLGVLLERRLARLLADVQRDVAAARALDGAAAVDLLLRRLVESVSAERDLFRVLLREAPELGELPNVRRARAAFFAFGGVGARAERNWLVSRMVANAVLELAFLDAPAGRRERLVRELVALVQRMLLDVRPGGSARAPAGARSTSR